MDEKLIAVALLYSLIGTPLTSALVAVILGWLLRERLGLGHTRRLRRGRTQIPLIQVGALAAEVAVALRRKMHAVVRVEMERQTSRSDMAGEIVFDLLANLQGAIPWRNAGRTLRW